MRAGTLSQCVSLTPAGASCPVWCAAFAVRELQQSERKGENNTYDSHVVEAEGGTVHADTEEGEVEAKVELGAGATLEDGARVRLVRLLQLGHVVPAGHNMKKVSVSVTMLAEENRCRSESGFFEVTAKTGQAS